MGRFKRSDRVSTLIHREISHIIDKEFRDRNIGMVTVTGVNVSRDLKYARIYVSLMGAKENTEESLKILNDKAGFIRGRLAGKIEIRSIPEIKFLYDSSTLDGMRIDKLLKEIDTES